jgi:rRNA-processing protein FCF1
MFVELRPGTTPEEAWQILNSLSMGAQNVLAGIGPDQNRARYLDWVEQAEGQLRNVFADPRVWEGLYSDIHWQIRRMGNEEPRPLPLMKLELGRQEERFERLQVGMHEIRNWVGRSSSQCVVIDTNVLLHYVPPDQIDWSEVVGSDEDVRLIVPLRVVNELDDKKYARDNKISKRARSVLSQVGNALLASDSAPAEITDGVSLEVAPISEPRERPLDADSEILACCLTLAPYAPGLLLATGDTAMRIRAQQLGIDTKTLPDTYLRSNPTTS